MSDQQRDQRTSPSQRQKQGSGVSPNTIIKALESLRDELRGDLKSFREEVAGNLKNYATRSDVDHVEQVMTDIRANYLRLESQVSQDTVAIAAMRETLRSITNSVESLAKHGDDDALNNRKQGFAVNQNLVGWFVAFMISLIAILASHISLH